MSHSSNASIHFLSLHLAVYVEKASHLLNNGKCEREMLFFSERYELALLKIEVESTIEVEPPCVGSRPCYNDKVLTLARDEKGRSRGRMKTTSSLSTVNSARKVSYQHNLFTYSGFLIC